MMTQEELQKYYQSKYPHKDALNQEELDWISSQEDIDWAIDNVLQARQNKNTEEQHKRNKRYWSNPIKNIFNNWIEGKPIKDIFKGTNERWSASLDNNTNPINGLVNVGLPAVVLTGAVMNPFGTAGAVTLGGAATLAGDAAINAATDGKYTSIPGFIQDKTGVSRFTSELINPLMLLGAKYGYKGGTNIGSRLFNGLHLPIGYDPVDGWYKRRPYSIMQETPALPSVPSVGASPLEVGQKPFAVLPAPTTASIPASARRVQALSTPTEIPSSGVSIVTPPTDLSRGTWDFYRSAMQENPVLALPSVQAWLRQYGDLRTPQQWMLAGTRNLNLQSGANNPRSALFNAFGRVNFREGAYRGIMPSFAEGVAPVQYIFTPGSENPMIGTMHIPGAPAFKYNLADLPFQANFEPVIREGRVLGIEGNRMNLSSTGTHFTGEGTPGSYLEVFGGPISRVQQSLQNRRLFMTGQLPRRGTTQFTMVGGRPMATGTNIFGNQIWLRTLQDGDGRFARRWVEFRPNNERIETNPMINGHDLDIDAFIHNLDPLINEGTQLEPAKVRTVLDPFSGPSQNRGLALPGNMGHYQLKSLMQGSPLEKQVGKNGEINVGNLLTYIQKNGQSVEQDVIPKVLKKYFADQRSVNYADLKAKVSHHLYRYDHGTANRYENYGLDRLGYPEVVGQSEMTPMVYLMEHPKIPIGAADHYNENTLGHIRTAVHKAEPDVLYILESQSDWGQHYELEKGSNPMVSPEVRAEFEQLGNMIAEFTAGNRDPLNNSKFDGDIVQARAQYRKYRDMLNGTHKRYNATTQQIHLHKNYQTKQIQEAVLIAAKNGQKKLRFPIEETAAKIEGFRPRKYYVDPQTNERMEEFEAPRLNEQTGQYEIPQYFIEQNGGYDGRYKTILKKYSDFPKMWKKLFKTEPRIVTDSKGNTWYEVDVPEGYLDQEWQFKTGGKLNYLTMFR